jgi:hypothetical protein
MPPATQPQRTESPRSKADKELRDRVNWLFNALYNHSWLLFGLGAAGITAYAFTIGFAEGARSIIFFCVPSLWGAFMLLTNDGEPKAMAKIPEPVTYGLAVIAGLVLASVLFLDTPVSIANLALGVMAGFFLLMRLSDQKTAHTRWFPPEGETLLRALLIMVTVTCIVIAVVL